LDFVQASGCCRINTIIVIFLGTAYVAGPSRDQSGRNL
jgi:hypothetical protein